jgi:ATP-dependent RNA helicase DeaD
MLLSPTTRAPIPSYPLCRYDTLAANLTFPFRLAPLIRTRLQMIETTAPPELAIPATFDEMDLDPSLRETLRELNFQTPTEIQAHLIPPALEGKDCLGQAKTGTGKTAAFVIPMLMRLKPGAGLQAIVLVPTRELAAQVDDHVRHLAKHSPLKTALAYGGRRIKSQVDQIKRGAEILIGTPGRVLDLMHRKVLDLANIKIAVLDEVDRMLDIGFRDDIRRILRTIKAPHQTIFVSATIDDDIRTLAHTYMHDEVDINVSRDTLTVEGVEHGFVPVGVHDKAATLLSFLKHEAPTLTIVFTNTKQAARRVARRLQDAGINCKEIHGDLEQAKRERVMKSFRAQHIQVLVATDLASRGLDVMEISHIVNYDVPEDPEQYIHRIGRTARMGQSGYAVTFVKPDQGKFLTEIEKLLNHELPRFDAPWVVRRALEPPPKVQLPVEAAPPAAAPPTSTRFREATQHDAVLESLGLRPVRRTLGSRFLTTRSSRRKKK